MDRQYLNAKTEGGTSRRCHVVDVEDDSMIDKRRKTVEKISSDDMNREEMIKQVAVLGAMIIVSRLCRKTVHIPRAPYRKRSDWFMKVVVHGSTDMCRHITQMEKETFFSFCLMLKQEGLLRDSINVDVEEQVAMSLYILGHHTRVVSLVAIFGRSRETIHRYFHEFLSVVCGLAPRYIKLPSTNIPEQILNSSRYYPWFKDCLGAVDGTHVTATVSTDFVGKCRGRKGPTQNILAAVDFNLKFLYILSGWEGSANDMAVLKAATCEKGFKIPEGKYYLCDAGYTTMPGFISPFRGTRYHLKDFSRVNGPRNEHELFNLRHAQLRNKVECAFGVLKMRWRILTTRSSYSYECQVACVMACCVLHNYIIDQHPLGDAFVSKEDLGLDGNIVEDPTYTTFTSEITPTQRKRRNAPWVSKKEDIARSMWTDYLERMSK